jgi:hypothetical protein
MPPALRAFKNSLAGFNFVIRDFQARDRLLHLPEEVYEFPLGDLAFVPALRIPVVRVVKVRGYRRPGALAYPGYALKELVFRRV